MAGNYVPDNRPTKQINHEGKSYNLVSTFDQNSNLGKAVGYDIYGTGLGSPAVMGPGNGGKKHSGMFREDPVTKQMRALTDQEAWDVRSRMRTPDGSMPATGSELALPTPRPTDPILPVQEQQPAAASMTATQPTQSYAQPSTDNSLLGPAPKKKKGMTTRPTLIKRNTLLGESPAGSKTLLGE